MDFDFAKVSSISLFICTKKPNRIILFTIVFNENMSKYKRKYVRDKNKGGLPEKIIEDRHPVSNIVFEHEKQLYFENNRRKECERLTRKAFKSIKNRKLQKISVDPMIKVDYMEKKRRVDEMKIFVKSMDDEPKKLSHNDIPEVTPKTAENPTLPNLFTGTILLPDEWFKLSKGEEKSMKLTCDLTPIPDKSFLGYLCKRVPIHHLLAIVKAIKPINVEDYNASVGIINQEKKIVDLIFQCFTGYQGMTLEI